MNSALPSVVSEGGSAVTLEVRLNANRDGCDLETPDVYLSLETESHTATRDLDYSCKLV